MLPIGDGRPSDLLMVGVAGFECGACGCGVSGSHAIGGGQTTRVHGSGANSSGNVQGSDRSTPLGLEWSSRATNPPAWTATCFGVDPSTRAFVICAPD